MAEKKSQDFGMQCANCDGGFDEMPHNPPCHLAKAGPMSEQDERIFDWRLVKAGEVAPLKGGHGSWVETDHPAVIACMGSAPECAANGCQAERWQRERNEAKQLLGRAAMEINVAGPVHERIQVLRAHLTKAAEEEIAKREAAEARVQAWKDAAGGLEPDEFTVKDRGRTNEHNILVTENRALLARVQALTVALRDARNALAYLDQHPFVGADAELAAIDAALTEPRREEHIHSFTHGGGPCVTCGESQAEPRREEEREK